MVTAFTEEPMGILLVAMLGVLAAAALATAAVTMMSVVALALAPLLAAGADRLRRWRWRDWHPPTDWMPADPVTSARSVPARPVGCGVVAAREPGVAVRLVTAADPARRAGADPTLTAVHATLAPTTSLDLPAHARCGVLVCVLSGHGTVGAERRHVGAGDLTVLGPGDPVTVSAAAEGAQPPMEVLVAQVPAPTPAAEPRPEPAPAGEAAPAGPRRLRLAARAAVARAAHGWAHGARRRPAA